MDRQMNDSRGTQEAGLARGQPMWEDPGLPQPRPCEDSAESVIQSWD